MQPLSASRAGHITGIRVKSSHEEVLAFAGVQNDLIKMINAGAVQTTAKKQVGEGKAKN
jgi:hypothetical protein